MAILGGGVGGAGNPVGGSFTGASLSLEYILDRCYAYSGIQQAAQSDQILLEFTTGNKLIVGHITCTGAIDNTNSEIGAISAFALSFNGGEVTRMKTETAQEDMPPYTTYPILIPPYTEVKLVVLSNATIGACSAIIVGQTFQTRD